MLLHLHWLLLEFTQRRGGGGCSQSVAKSTVKGQTLGIDAVYWWWWTSVVIHCARYWTLESRRQNRASSMSSAPAVREAYPSTLRNHLLVFSFLLLPSLLFFRHRSSLFLSLSLFFFLLLASPSLFLTLHCLFSDSKMWGSLYLDAPLLSPWFLSLYLTSFFFFFFPCRWRTDSQKRSKIHQCCIVAAFWSAWWVTTQPRAIIYKCVFINTRSIYM